jgi:outer membrane receptor protein involved in Fe transport
LDENVYNGGCRTRPFHSSTVEKIQSGKTAVRLVVFGYSTGKSKQSKQFKRRANMAAPFVRFSRFVQAAAIFVALAIAPFSHGQAITGRLLGTVQDSSHAAVPNARITITNQDTGITTVVTGDSHGYYIAPSLASGKYKINVEASGFRKEIANNNIVNVAQDTRVDFTMQVGSVSESVEVSGSAPLVSTTTSELGETIDHDQIQKLPLNGRFFSQLVLLTPGAVPDGQTDNAENSAAAGARSSIQADVNGLPYPGGSYTVDGVANKEPANGYISLSPPLEAVQEFKVQTHNPSAEFGGYGGSIVNLQIRSGTNQFHGSAFEYFRNDALNAKNFFQTTAAPLRSNQFGATFGGPILKNKAFFFADYQGLRLRYPRIFGPTEVPSLLMRQGIFSAAEGFGPIYDPVTKKPFNDLSGTKPCADASGNMTSTECVIPPARWDGVAKNILNANIYPLPNRPPTKTGATGPANNYTSAYSDQNDPDQFDVKVDYNFSEKSHVFVRESYAHRSLVEPPPGGFRFLAIGRENSTGANHNAVIGHTYVLSPSWLNELRLGYNRFSNFHTGIDNGVDENNALGLANGNLPGFPNTSGIASFAFGTGFVGTSGPGSSNGLRLSNSYELTDSVTWIKGGHNIKFGADLTRLDVTVTNPESDSRGTFDFSSGFTSITAKDPTTGKNAQFGGAPWASFLLGYPNRVRRGIVNTDPDAQRYLYGFYFQDDYRITGALTLNLGARYDRFSGFAERRNHETNLNLVDGLLHLATDSNRGPDVKAFNGLAPRVGFAYTPDQGRTAIRGAFGMSYFNDNFGANGGTLERNFPFFQTFDVSGGTPFWTLDCGNSSITARPTSNCGAPGFIQQALTPTFAVPKGITPFTVPGTFHPDTSMMWNFGIEREFAHGMAADVSYVGTRGEHLFRSVNVNAKLLGSGIRMFDGIVPPGTTVTERYGGGDSYYNALQAKLSKRYSGGLAFLFSYTYAKDIDTGGAGNPGSVSQGVYYLFDNRLNRGPANIDLRHNFVASYVYDLPFGHSRRWLANTPTVVDTVLGGWEFSGITTLRTGYPLTITTNQQLSAGVNNRADNHCGSVRTIGSSSQWFDTSCYTIPVNGAGLAEVLGDSGRGSARGPGVANLDLSLDKSFAMGEKRSLEFNASAFNAFNTPHFGNPNTNRSDSSFGTITGTNGAFPNRELQLGLKFVF